MKGAFSFFAQLLRDESVLRFGCSLQRASCSVNPRVAGPAFGAGEEFVIAARSNFVILIFF